MRRIVVASDFSKASRKAFATAVAWAKRNGAALTIVHVTTPFLPFMPDQYVSPDTLKRLDEQSHRWIKQRLSKLIDTAKRAGVRATGVTADGNAAEQVVRIARAKHADLLVVGTHGRTGLEKFFVGSVAARIVATAPCPVVTVRS
jgi:nucleotide-binding universal stress UspA family protein